MALDVICISSEDGADAPRAAELVATTLGYRVIDEEIVRRAAEEAGVDSAAMADVERRKSLVARLLDSFSPAGAGISYMVPAPSPEAYGGPSGDDLRGFIRSVIETTAERGRVVIVAHAASLALGDRDGVLRVLVTASPSTRARRMAAALDVDVEEAAKQLKRSDTGRQDYMKRFYGIDRELPSHYDLVVSTDRLSADEAAALIVHAAGHVAEPA